MSKISIFILLAVVQGLTEFFPVSSSGHLYLFSLLFGQEKSNLLYVLCLHAGTALAALCFFRREIWAILRGLADFFLKKNTLRSHYALKWVGLITMVSLPTLIAGLILRNYIESLSVWTPFMLIITGTILWSTQFARNKHLSLRNFSFKNAFLVGVAQSFGLLTGISRSGITISTALFLGATPKFAGKLSFLASFVPIFGALFFELFHVPVQELSVSWKILTIGFVTAFFVGLFALRFLMAVLNSKKFYLFAYYCFAVAITAIALLKGFP